MLTNQRLGRAVEDFTAWRPHPEVHQALAERGLVKQVIQRGDLGWAETRLCGQSCQLIRKDAVDVQRRQGRGAVQRAGFGLLSDHGAHAYHGEDENQQARPSELTAERQPAGPALDGTWSV